MNTDPHNFMVSPYDIEIATYFEITARNHHDRYIMGLCATMFTPNVVIIDKIGTLAFLQSLANCLKDVQPNMVELTTLHREGEKLEIGDHFVLQTPFGDYVAAKDVNGRVQWVWTIPTMEVA